MKLSVLLLWHAFISIHNHAGDRVKYSSAAIYSPSQRCKFVINFMG